MEIEKNKSINFKEAHADEIKLLDSKVTIHNDFPKKGVHFADIFPLLNDAHTFHLAIDLLAQWCKEYDISAIASLEARGFIIGAPLAYILNKKFIPIRKPGKTPGPVYSVQYMKEYGPDSLNIEQTALKPNERVLLVDDIIATGGSAQAAIELIKKAGAIPVAFTFLLEIEDLKGKREKLSIPSFVLMN